MSKYVTFTLDESFGRLLTTIAREHLTQNYNVENSIKSITESLIGITREQSLDVIVGTWVITIRNNEDAFLEEYDPNLHKDYKPLNVEWFIKSLSGLERQANNLIEAIRSYKQKNFIFSFSVGKILRGISTEFDSIIEEIEEQEDMTDLVSFTRLVQSFILISTKKIVVAKFMWNTWRDSDPKLLELIKEAQDNISQVSFEFQSMYVYQSELALSSPYEERLDAYLNSIKEIDSISKVGITPIDLMTKPDACWLSPDGVCYGLNGDIANMLHDQIANMLVDVGIIPKDHEFQDNDHLWLLRNGWVKIHGKEVGFEGHMNEHLGYGKNKFMTTKQIDMITDYSRNLYGGILTFSFQSISALQFQSMIKNLPSQFYNKYLFGNLK